MISVRRSWIEDRRTALSETVDESCLVDGHFCGEDMIGGAKSRFRTATHALAVVRGSSERPLFVTAAGMPAADAADLGRRMADRHRLPDALRRADTLARTSPPAATMTDRQPD